MLYGSLNVISSIHGLLNTMLCGLLSMWMIHFSIGISLANHKPQLSGGTVACYKSCPDHTDTIQVASSHPSSC